MARIPLQIAQRTLDIGSVVQYPQGGGPVGAALERAGDVALSLAGRVRQADNQQDAFDAGIVENEFRSNLSMQEQQAVQNAPANGSGIHDSVYGEIDPATKKVVKPGSFDKLFDSYAERMPQSKRQDFLASREAFRAQGSLRLAESQYNARQAYEGVELKKAQDQFLNTILQTGDDQTFDSFRQEGLDWIERSGLSPLDKEKAAYNWKADAAKALYQARLEKDPKAAVHGRDWLGLGPAGSRGKGSILDAMRSVESGGDPNAESGKGASGSMQVMPATGREIARELGDTNFPMNGSDAEVKAYLKSDGVSERYGEHYYDKMLRRYNGDVEAALIGYNGGPDRADAWIAAGRDDSVIPAESANYYKKVLSRAGQSAPVAVPNLPDTSSANAFLRGRLVGHSADHIDNLQPAMQQRLAAMLQAAPPEIAGKLGIYSGARSIERQSQLWQAALKKYGSAAAARKWVAPPGNSNHNHGRAADLSYDGKSLKDAPPEVVAWVHDNAERFGLKFPLGNENWHVEMAETRGGKSYTPSAGADPRFADLTPSDRLALANESDRVLAERQKADLANQKADYSAYKDSMQLGIVQGKVRDEAIISNDPTLDDGDKATLITSLRAQNEKLGQVQSDLSALTGNSLTLDAYSSKDKTRADNLFTEAATGMPQDKQMAMAGAIIEQTGIVPQPVVNSIRKGLTSTNAAEVVAAAQAAQRITSYDPAALGRRDGGAEAQKAADDFRFYVDRLNLSPEDAAQRLIDNNSPEKKLSRKAMEPAAKEFVKLMGDVDLAGEFDTSGLFGNAITVGMTVEQELGIKADFVAIAEDQFYASNGDPDLAKNRALQEMKRLYGVTGFGPTQAVVKHPPERYWPAQRTTGYLGTGIAADPWSYARVQLNQDVSALSPDYQPGSIMLITTPETDAMVKRGELPGYAVMWKDKDGVLQTMPGKLWRPDPTKIQAIDAANAERAQAARTADAKAKRPYLWPDAKDFAAGNDPVFGDRDAPPTQPLRPSRPAPGTVEEVAPSPDDSLVPTPGGAL